MIYINIWWTCVVLLCIIKCNNEHNFYSQICISDKLVLKICLSCHRYNCKQETGGIWGARELYKYSRNLKHMHSIQFQFNFIVKLAWQNAANGQSIKWTNKYTNSAQQSTIGYTKLSWGNIHLACTCTHSTVKRKECLVGVFLQHSGEEVTVRKIGWMSRELIWVCAPSKAVGLRGGRQWTQKWM